MHTFQSTCSLSPCPHCVQGECPVCGGWVLYGPICVLDWATSHLCSWMGAAFMEASPSSSHRKQGQQLWQKGKAMLILGLWLLFIFCSLCTPKLIKCYGNPCIILEMECWINPWIVLLCSRPWPTNQWLPQCSAAVIPVITACIILSLDLSHCSPAMLCVAVSHHTCSLWSNLLGAFLMYILGNHQTTAAQR